MKSRTHLAASVVLVACIALLTLSPMAAVNAADDALTNSVRVTKFVCDILGGTLDYNSNYSGSEPVRNGGTSTCSSGLAGFKCTHTEDGILNCTATRTVAAEDTHVSPGEGIDANDTSAPGETTAGSIVTQAVLVDPEPGISPEQRTIDLINSCRVLGGTESVTTVFDLNNVLIGGGVNCTGGVLDGFDCVKAFESFVCQWLRGVPDGEMVIVTNVTLVTELPRTTVAEDAPAAPPPVQPQMTATEVSAAPVATDTPPEPTLAPTALAAEPTVAPTQPSEPPTFPMPPGNNDNAVPPGEVEEPAPMPTEVVLT
jgi:hypothetical protein